MPEIEEHIRRAIEEGKFDNLPGQGKPLDLGDDTLADPDWRLAHHMLRSSGYSLPWIELRQEIQAEADTARGTLRRAWEWREAALAQGQPSERVQGEWMRAVEAFRKQTESINKKIFNYNLQAPSEIVQLFKLDTEREIAAVVAGDPKPTQYLLGVEPPD
jgi:DnaJ family protein C protein 28